MGRNKILTFGIMLLVLIGLIYSFPAIKDMLSEYFKSYIETRAGRPQLPMRENDKNECGYCHSDKHRDFSKKYQHAPFANWFCKDCHATHTVGSGKYEYVVEIDKLCTTCHFNRKQSSVYSYQHMPYEKGHCTDCHDPHASDYEHLLIRRCS